MDLLREFWTYILAAVALVAWSVRVEQKTKENEKEIRRLWLQRTEDLTAAKEAREATNSLLAEMRSDIKELLRQTRG
jgi:predicted YcjX-like family ATPase